MISDHFFFNGKIFLSRSVSIRFSPFLTYRYDRCSFSHPEDSIAEGCGGQSAAIKIAPFELALTLLLSLFLGEDSRLSFPVSCVRIIGIEEDLF